MTTHRSIRLTALALLATLLVASTAAPARAGIFSPITDFAQAIAKSIVTVVRGDQAPAAPKRPDPIDAAGDAKRAEAMRAEARANVERLLAELRAAGFGVDTAETVTGAGIPYDELERRLEKIEAQEAVDFQDLAVSMAGGTAAPRPTVALALETENLPETAGKAYEPPPDGLEKLKSESANSSAFKDFFARLKAAVPEAETKTWVDYTTKKEKSSALNPPDFEVRYRTGTSMVIDKFENKQKTGFTWDSDPKPVEGSAGSGSKYVSNFLNVQGDPSLQNKTLTTAKNNEFDSVSLAQGNTKFGWTHIAYDRPDGTCHAREIMTAFNLPDQDESVRQFIMDTVATGNAEEQVRTVNGQEQRRMLYTRTVDGQEIKVVVDKDKYPGSLITAYPTGKVKAPRGEELKRLIEEEAKKKAEEAKKNVKWRKPTLSIDLFKREKTVAVGPQWSAGASQKFRLGGADIVNSASLDTLLGAEATGAVYGGIQNGALSAGVRGSVFAGARARGNLSSDVKVGNLGVRGFVGGEVSAGAGANGDAHVGIGKNGLEASVSGDAFVGVRAKGQVGGTLSYGDVKATGSLNGTIGAGLGAHFDVTGKIGWSGVKAHVDVGAYLGIGGQLGFDINLDFGSKLDPLKKAVEGAVEKGKQVVNKVKDGIKKLFSWK